MGKRRKGLSQAEQLAAEYSPKLAAQKPAPEPPEAVRARTERALALADAEDRAARAKARQAITSRRELEQAARKLRQQLRGEEE